MAFASRIIITILLIKIIAAQNQNCGFNQNVQVGTTYQITSPGYPNLYPGGLQCRWTGVCPSGYNCRVACPNIEIPESPSCSMDRFLVSRTGDSQLADAQVYCGTGNLTAVSTGQRIVLGLITANNSRGGRIFCQLSAVAATNPC